MENDIILTGSQFRQYVHISTRKMKYLMDNDIVPHNNTGKATHKYEIRKSDADEYLLKIKNDSYFNSLCSGGFSSRHKQPVQIKQVSNDFAEKVESYFRNEWKNQSDILTSGIASELIGTNRQFIRRQYENGILKACIVKGSFVIPKSELIRFASCREHIINPPTAKLWKILRSIENN